MQHSKPIPYGRQHITEEDIQAVIKTLKSDYLTQGPRIAEFEDAFAQYVGAQYAVAVANGTAALHLCTLALDVKPGNKVITSPITFAASANCVRYCGGEVVFADIDPATYLLDIHEVRKLLEEAPKGTYQGIIPVDFAGRAVNMEAFRQLADEFGLWIIEDSCHAPGGYFTDQEGKIQLCGNGKFAGLAIFSFHPVKHIAAGEGGMITTNNKELYENLLVLRTHGITKSPDKYQNSVAFAAGIDAGTQDDTEHLPISQGNDKPQTNNFPGWYMEMQTLGYNYRLTDIQATLGLSQLSRADVGLKHRKAIAARYYNAFKAMPQIIDRNIQTPEHTSNHNGHAYHLYVIEVQNRLGLYQHLRNHKIYAQIHYIPCHLMPYYRAQGWKEGDLVNAEAYYKKCISLPMYPTLSIEDQKYVISKIKDFYSISL